MQANTSDPTVQEEQLYNDLATINAMYPEQEEFQCPVYRLREGDNKGVWVRTYHGLIPTEERLFDDLGGGKYKVWIKRRNPEGGLQLMRTVYLEIEGTPKHPGTQPNDTEAPKPGRPNFFGMDMSQLQQALLFMNTLKEMFGGGKGQGEITFRDILDVMKESNDKVLEVLKSRNNSSMEEIAVSMIKDGIKQTNPLETVKTLKTAIELMDGGAGGKKDILTAVAEQLPSIIQLAQSENSVKNLPVVSQSQKPNKIVFTSQDIDNLTGAILKRIESRIKEITEEVLLDYKLIIPAEDDHPEPETQEAPPETFSEQPNQESENSMNPEQKTVIALIKKLSKQEKLKILKAQAAIHPLEEVRKFCIDTKLVPNDKTFRLWCQEAGIEVS